MKVLNSFAAILTASLIFVCSGFVANAQVPESQVSVNNQIKADNLSEERYKIGYQDSLQIVVYTVLNNIKFNENVSVSPDGTIRLPGLVEPVTVVCKTERELSGELTAAYGKNYLRNPYVSVRATDQRSQSFAVIGAVTKPGNFYSNRKVRLLELLAWAGGDDVEKAGTKLIVARLGSRSSCNQNKPENSTENQEAAVYQFNINDVKLMKQNFIMEPGDIVSVLDADVVYVYGNVNKQGSIKLTRPVTLRQAIASAEGFAPASKKDKIRVIRQKEGSAEWDEIVYNLKDIDTGKAQDPLLLPNDIVAVGEDKLKSLVQKIGNSLTNGIPSLFYRVP